MTQRFCRLSTCSHIRIQHTGGIESNVFWLRLRTIHAWSTLICIRLLSNANIRTRLFGYPINTQTAYTSRVYIIYLPHKICALYTLNLRLANRRCLHIHYGTIYNMHEPTHICDTNTQNEHIFAFVNRFSPLYRALTFLVCVFFSPVFFLLACLLRNQTHR